MQGGMTQRVNGYGKHFHQARRRRFILSAQLARLVIEGAVATAFQIPCRELRARTRRKAQIAFARQVAMYLAHIAYGLTLTEVGALFKRDRTTVAHACSLIEDRRDDPLFDTFLDHLEMVVVCLARALKALEA